MQKRYAALEDWEPHRTIITKLYHEQNKTLGQTMDVMAREYKFFATPKMFKTRLRKWGLYKNRTASHMMEMNDLLSGSDAAGIHPQMVIRGCHGDLYNPRRCSRHRGLETPIGLDDKSSETANATGRNLLTRYAKMRPKSIPAAMRAPNDLQSVEEALRITNNYIQGSTESGRWVYNEKLRGIFGRRGLDGWDEMWMWLNRVMEAVQHIQLSRTSEGFCLLNKCLDTMASHLRYQESTMLYYLLVFTQIKDQKLQRSLNRHTQDLAGVVLGSQHPFTLAWRRLTSFEADNIASRIIKFIEVIGVKHVNFDHPLRLHPPRSLGPPDKYMSALVGADTGYAHILESLDEAAKLVELSRTFRERVWENDPKEPVVSMIAFDLMIAIIRGLRLHGENTEAALALDTAGRWLFAMDRDSYSRRVASYFQELKAFGRQNLAERPIQPFVEELDPREAPAANMASGGF